jgi:hypothetical protein
LGGEEAKCGISVDSNDLIVNIGWPSTIEVDDNFEFKPKANIIRFLDCPESLFVQNYR